MINALDLYARIKGEWDKTGQPLKERASVLPLGLEVSQQDTDPALLDYLAAVGPLEPAQPVQPLPHGQMPAPSDLDLKVQEWMDLGIDPLDIFRLAPPRPEDPNAPRPWFDRRG